MNNLSSPLIKQVSWSKNAPTPWLIEWSFLRLFLRQVPCASFLQNKKLASKSVQGCTFQNGHGCPWFHAEASFCRAKLVVEQCTRRYIAQHRHGWRWFQTVAMFWLCQNSRPKVYKDVHFWTALGIEAVSFLPFIDKAKRYKRIARRHPFSAL